MNAMLNRRLLVLAAAPLALALAAATPHRAARHPAPPPPELPVPDVARVALATELGTIVLELDGKHAPVTTGNFLRYVDQRRLDGTSFYRAMHLAWGDQPNGLIQGGTQMDAKRILKPIAHEPTSQTGLLHKAGTISMARYAPGTATGDFSILLADQPSLDANPQAADVEGRAGFAAFGKVAAGMDVVRQIWAAPISATRGEGVMRGQMLERPVIILTARRVPLPAATP